MSKLKQVPPNETTKRNIESSDEEDSDSEEDAVSNKFANDGSFLELFRKMQQQQPQTSSTKQEPPAGEVSSKTSECNKRRPKILKVGTIEKRIRPDGSNSSLNSNDSALLRYMREVRTYKQKYGDDEDKNRPLVK